MWWPVVESGAGAGTRLAARLRMLYLFALGIPDDDHVRADHAFRRGAVSVVRGRAAGIRKPERAHDQQLGGLIMWVPGMIVFWTATTVVFFRWSRREERAELADRAALLRA